MSDTPKARPQNKHLQPGQHTQGLLRPDTPLESHEVARAVRIRAEREAFTWFASLTARERGDLVSELFAAKKDR